MATIMLGTCVGFEMLAQPWVHVLLERGHEVEIVHEANGLLGIILDGNCDLVILWDGELGIRGYEAGEEGVNIPAGFLVLKRAIKHGGQVPIFLLNWDMVRVQPYVLPEGWEGYPFYLVSRIDRSPLRFAEKIQRVLSRG